MTHRHLSSSGKLREYYKWKGWLLNNCLLTNLINRGIIQSNVSFMEFQPGNCGFGKAHCIHIGLRCQPEAMQWTGNLFLCFLPSACWDRLQHPPSMTLNRITRVEKTKEWMSASMWSAYTLQLSGRLTGWTTEPAQQKPHFCRSASLCEAPLERSYEIYSLHGPRGGRDPITGNTKWQEIISVYPGVQWKSHNRYILDHKVRMVSLWSCLVIGLY